MFGGWTKINIGNWVLEAIIYFTVFFDKKHSKCLQGNICEINSLSPPGTHPRKGRGAHFVLIFFSIYFTHVRLPIKKLILHSHNRFFRLCKSLKTTYTFSHKIKLTCLTANKTEKWTIFLVEVVTEKNMVLKTAMQNGSCVIWISKNIQKYWMFAVFTLNTMGARQTTKYDNDNLQEASWDLHQI